MLYHLYIGHTWYLWKGNGLLYRNIKQRQRLMCSFPSEMELPVTVVSFQKNVHHRAQHSLEGKSKLPNCTNFLSSLNLFIPSWRFSERNLAHKIFFLDGWNESLNELALNIDILSACNMQEFSKLIALTHLSNRSTMTRGDHPALSMAYIGRFIGR